MSIDKYNSFKARYENTRPIRGRAIECRPWGQRSRTHEQVTKVLTPQGEGYCAKLYNTDCVVVAPNGDMYIRTDGWNSYMTAEWINYRSGLRCYKKFSKTWISVDGRDIPLSSTGTLHIKYNAETHSYTCDKEVKMKQKVVDRAKSKEVRATVKPMRDYIKVMSHLADGWIGLETLEQLRKPPVEGTAYRGRWDYVILGERFSNWDIRGDVIYKTTAEKLLKLMQRYNEMTELDKVAMMCLLAEGCSAVDNRVVKTIDRSYTNSSGQTHSWKEEEREFQYKPSSITNRVDYIVKKASDIYTEREVSITKPVANLL